MTAITTLSVTALSSKRLTEGGSADMQLATRRSLLALTTGIAIPLALIHSSLAQRPAESSPPRSVLVELFTSEGCSSCPAADTFLQQINGQRLKSGELIVGLSEHVTYWNHLGWSDPFSSDVFTERQSAYSDRFGSGSVYTPEIVVNGSRESVGSDRTAVLQAIRTASASTAASGIRLTIKSAALSGNAVLLTYSISLQGAPPDADVYAVIADDLRQSHVARGENTGRTLSHVAVARSLTRLPELRSGETQSARLPLSVSNNSPSRHLILVVQARGPGQVLAVDSRPIDGPGSATAASAQALNR